MTSLLLLLTYDKSHFVEFVFWLSVLLLLLLLLFYSLKCDDDDNDNNDDDTFDLTSIIYQSRQREGCWWG